MHQKDVLFGVVVVLVLVVVALVSCCLLSENPSSNSSIMWLAVIASGLVLAAGGIATWDEKLHKTENNPPEFDAMRTAYDTLNKKQPSSDEPTNENTSNEYNYYGA
jgi:hypothetical protein